MRIKHKAGRKRSSYFITLRLWSIVWLYKLRGFKYGFKPKVQVEFRFDLIDSNYHNQRDLENDWLKGFGTKNGINTDTNKEEIAAYRKLSTGNLFTFETCKYVNFPDKSTRIVNTKRGFISRQVITLKHWIAVGSYAGGTYPPDNTFTYQLKVRYIGA